MYNNVYAEKNSAKKKRKPRINEECFKIARLTMKPATSSLI